MQVEFDNFVGIFTDVYCDDFCQDAIDLFERAKDQGFTMDRNKSEGVNAHFKDDDQLMAQTPIVDEFIDGELIDPGNKVFLEIFWEEIYPAYASKYSVLSDAANHRIYFNKLQKTIAGGGYHPWHFEAMNRAYCQRVMTYILYLNDLPEDAGGETEFLYLSKRIKPEKGKLLLFPGSYTHTHRGNPPLSGEKYIMTGWVEF